MFKYAAMLVAVFVVILLLIAIVRAIWNTLRWLTGTAPAAKADCQRCGTTYANRHSRCPACRWPESLPPVRRIEVATGAVQQQVERFANLGWLDEEARQQLQWALAQQRERLVGQLPKVPPVAPAAPILAELAESDDQPVAACAPAPAEPADVPQLAMPFAEWATPRVEPSPDESAGKSHTDGTATGEAPRPEEPLSVGERARRYAQRRHEPTPEAETAPPPPRREHQPLSKLLASFLDEKNIRWGELVGGLLIVCCSVALVLSFWSAIAQRPFLKFSLFNGITIALFLIGLYIHRRWRLPTTSHGLLIISMLLVPLNFLAIAALSTGTLPLSPIAIAGEVASLCVFAYLTFHAGQILAPSLRMPLAVAVVGLSAAELLVRRLVGPGVATAWLYAAAGLALALYVPPNIVGIWRAGRRGESEKLEAHALFKLLGITSFAFLLAAGLVVAKTGAVLDAVRQLAPLVSLAGLPALAGGLLLWRQLQEREQTGERIAGTSIAILGALAMAAGILFGWPQPTLILAAAALNAVLFLAAARLARFPAIHLAAAACLVLVYLVGFHVVGGELAWQSDAATVRGVLLSARSGTALIAAVLALGGAAGVLRRLARPESAPYYALAAAGTALLSLGLALRFGLGPQGGVETVWLLAFYGVAASAAAFALPRAALAWIGSTLLLLTLVEAFLFEYGDALGLSHPRVLTLLTHATLSAAQLVLLRVLNRPRQKPLRTVLLAAMIAAAACAAVLLFPLALAGEAAALALYALWLSLLALLGAAVALLPALLVAGQIFLTLAVYFAVAARLQLQPWWQEARWPWLDPWTLQAQLLALAGLSVVWTAMRVIARRAWSEKEDAAQLPARPGASLLRLISPQGTAVDRIVLGGAVAVAYALAVYAIFPGTAQELAPRPIVVASAQGALPPRIVPPLSTFELDGIPNAHAADTGAWWLLGGLAAALVLSFWDRFRTWAALSLLVLLAASMLLLSARFEPEVAVASALRWSSALLLMVGSLPIWFRTPFAAVAARCAWPDWTQRSRGLAGAARTALLVLALAPPVVMAAFVAMSALARHMPDAASLDRLWSFAVVAAVSALGAAALRLASQSTRRDSAADAEPAGRPALRHAGSLLFILGLAPLVAFGLYLIGTALARQPLMGPEATSIFARAGTAVSYALPVLVTALVLVGHALRERSAGLAFAAGLTFNLAATAGYLLAISQGGLKFDAAQWIRLAQVNTLVSGTFALAWLGCALLTRRRQSPLRGSTLLTTYAMLPVALLLLYVVPSGAALVYDPAIPAAGLAPAGDLLGWLSLAVACLILLLHRGRSKSFSVGTVAAGLVVLSTVLALFCLRWDTGNWLAFRVLLLSTTASGALVLLGGRTLHRWLIRPQAAVTWSVAVAVLAVLLALRALDGPSAPWWSVAVLVVDIAVLIAAAATAPSRPLLYWTVPLVNFTATLAWDEFFSNQSFFPFNILALALPTVLWLWLELRYVMPAAEQRRSWLPPLHRMTAVVALVGSALIVAVHLVEAFEGGPPPRTAVWNWPMLLTTSVAIFANLYDRRARFPLFGLYLGGLLLVAAGLSQLGLERDLLWQACTMFLAAYVLGTSYLWSRRKGLRAAASHWRVPRRETPRAGLRWLAPTNCTAAAVVIGLAFSILLTDENLQARLWMAQAVIVQAFAIGLLARGTRRSQLQFAALAVGILGGIAFGWAWLDPDAAGSMLDHGAVLIAALAAMAALYGLGLIKILRRENAWTRAAQRLVPLVLAAGAVAVAGVLAVEVFAFVEQDAVPISLFALVTVAVALAGLAVASLAAAVLPGRDPLSLSESGRMAYVYAAEVLLALEFLHIRITMPWLFEGTFSRYWPLIVIGIAFLGVGFSELFRRRQQRVLAQPLERTATFLPLLPVLGFWLHPGEVHYSLLLVGVGALYAALAVLRHSLVAAISAVLAANGALWYLLHDARGLGLLEHPQLWLIPPALSVLIAAYLNRGRLERSQLTSIRYGAATVIYVSSTADIFLNGVAEAPWLPLVLAGLSIAGIFAGILWRVRSFLFLGTAFLLLALLTIIWHAAVDLEQTWLWFATGIVTGVLIIALFAVFEKKRQDVLELVEKLRQWEQ